ncbi:TonB-dependent receptor domain-containing protein [Brevundimonas sp.]|uniref:TonB-dependent receptor domain-containing protein n=1 Tax=Brevundimonas sp. TaxID=1871086 RepID=UPI0028A03190|nr:TonB-dependent receptor [Brevundimonas sp.]
MKMNKLKLGRVLLATSALGATVMLPGAVFAQTVYSETPSAAADLAPEADDQSPTSVAEIIVRGRNIPQQNRATAEVAAFLTQEDLQRTGDSTAAAALTRVTGLSIVEGRFVYVRGLGERYSSALLNGSPLPSPEPLQRVVPLDLFPASVLKGVQVQKSYSPDFPGEFGGGVINLSTVEAPAEAFLDLKVGIGGNTETTGKDNLVYYGSDTDWTGFDNDTRKLPGQIALAFREGKQINRANYSAQALQAMGHSLVNAPLRLLQMQQTPVDSSVEISGGFTSPNKLGDLGVIVAVGYDNSWRAREATQQEGMFEGDGLVPRSSYTVQSNQNDIRLNFLGGLSLSNENHEVKWTNMYVRSTTKEARSAAGPDFDAGGSIIRNDYTEWFERQLFTTQLAGEHYLGGGNWKLDWRAAYAKSTRDAPYETRFQYGVDANGRFIHNVQGNLISFSELEDEVLSGGIDLAYSVPMQAGREATIKVGAATLDNTRNAERHDLQFEAVNGLTDSQRLARVDYLFSDYNINPNTLQLREIAGGNGASAYDADLKTNAAYAMVDAEFWPTLRTTFGVRYEDGKQSVTPRSLFAGSPTYQATENNADYWLPSFTATWNFVEEQQLRFGVSKTIGRPQFRELAPQTYTDPESDRIFIGNPYLVDTEILNLDARWEWYFAPQQFVTAGVFYKKMDKPVEAVIVDVGNQRQQSFLNAPEATIMGIELEAKKYYEFASNSDFIANKRWLIQANYTWSDSEVSVGDDDTVMTLGGAGAPEQAKFFIRDGVRMQGQSEHVANMQLGWEDDNARSQATLILNYVSERITARGAGTGGAREPDYLQEPGAFLDFVYRKDFTIKGQDMGLAFEARNLLSTDFEEFQEQNGRILVNAYELGQSFSLSVTARF